MRLYLDDLRPTPDGFTARVYTAQEAIDMLKTNMVEHISFDHDLGEPENGTGYDVAKWIEYQVATNPDFKAPSWEIHSANPVGAKNIRAAMSRGYTN
jgi:hypothetical protein